MYSPSRSAIVTIGTLEQQMRLFPLVMAWQLLLLGTGLSYGNRGSKQLLYNVNEKCRWVWNQSMKEQRQVGNVSYMLMGRSACKFNTSNPIP
jgi:hypothetical protein